MSITSVVIVGASLAGAKATESLRAAGYDGRITLVGAEDELPYERPSLSKGFLMGKAERDSLLVHPQSWYDAQRVELRLGTRVESLDQSGDRSRWPRVSS